MKKLEFIDTYVFAFSVDYEPELNGNEFKSLYGHAIVAATKLETLILGDDKSLEG